MSIMSMAELEREFDSLRDQPESLANRLATGIVGRMFNEMDILRTKGVLYVEHNSSQDLVNWFIQITDLVIWAGKMQSGFSLVRAYALAVIQDAWDDLPLELRKPYNLDFWVYARVQTGDKERSTIDNYIRTARTWFMGGLDLPKEVRVVRRDSSGKIVQKDGEPVYETIEFNPATVMPSKLLVCNARVKAGTMTDELWTALADPYYDYGDVRTLLTKSASNGGVEGLVAGIQFYFVGPVLVARVDGEEVLVAEEFNWGAYYDEPDGPARFAIERLCLLLGIRLDEVIISDEMHRKHLGVLGDDYS